MKKHIFISFIVLFALVCVTDSYGQKRRYGYNKKNKRYSNYSGGGRRRAPMYGGMSGKTVYWTAGFSLNAMNYFGDISPTPKRLSTKLGFTRAGFGITASRVVYPGIFLRAGYNFGTIKGDDSETADPNGDQSTVGRYSRNFHFKNNIHELSVGFEADLIPNGRGPRSRFPINPYLFLGVTVFHHAPKAKAPAVDQAGNDTGRGGDWVDLRSVGTEGQHIDTLGLKPYPKFNLAIPIGLGVKVRLPANFDLNVELGFRKLFTDYLDDIGGGSYVDLAAFGDNTPENNLARALSERGAEPIAAATGKERAQVYGTNQQGPYTTGVNYSSNGSTLRGGASDNDLYLVTQIRLVYNFDQKRRSRGKFR